MIRERTGWSDEHFGNAVAIDIADETHLASRSRNRVTPTASIVHRTPPSHRAHRSRGSACVMQSEH
jgi:hypothetical protein